MVDDADDDLKLSVGSGGVNASEDETSESSSDKDETDLQDPIEDREWAGDDTPMDFDCCDVSCCKACTVSSRVELSSPLP
jgi:hypothetical protein